MSMSIDSVLEGFSKQITSSSESYRHGRDFSHLNPEEYGGTMEEAVATLRRLQEEDNRLSVSLFISSFILLRLRRWQVRSCARIKKQKIRRLGLEEMVKNQRAYLKDMHILEDKIAKPLLQLNLITQQQKKILFQNLLAIIQLHQTLLKDLQTLLAGYDRRKSTISRVFFYHLPSFKIYTEYTQGYNKGSFLLTKLRQASPSFDSFISTAEKQIKQTVESLRIKPVQQVPRYVLQIEGIVKNTDPTHQDRASLCRALQQLKAVNIEIDKNLRRQQIAKKISQLDAKFKQVIRASREYVFGGSGVLLGKYQQKVTLHLLSDLLLVTTQSDDTELLRVELSHDSVCEPQVQAKYFKHIYFVCGSNCAACIFFSSQKIMLAFHKEAASVLQRLVERELEKRTVRKINFSQKTVVRVPYAEEEYRVVDQSRSLVFCLQFELLGFRFRAKKNMSELEKSYDVMREKLMLSVKLHTSSGDAGTIRTLNGGSYLKQFIRLNLQVQVNNLLKGNLRLGAKIAFALGVPLYFTDFAQNCNKPESIHYMALAIRDKFLRGEDGGNVAERMVNLLHYQFRLNPFSTYGSNILVPMKLSVGYPQIDRESQIVLEVDRRDSAHRVLLRIGNQLQLSFVNDYCLVLLTGKGAERRLDFDQCIGQVLGCKEYPRQGIVGLVASTLSRPRPTLLLRKMIFLPVRLEAALYQDQSMLQRLNLLVQQLFFRFSKGEFQHMNARQVAVIAVYFLYLRDPSSIVLFKNSTQPFKRVKKLIPVNILNTRSESNWVQIILEQISQIKADLEQRFSQYQFYLKVVKSFGDYCFLQFKVKGKECGKDQGDHEGGAGF